MAGGILTVDDTLDADTFFSFKATRCSRNDKYFLVNIALNVIFQISKASAS